MRRRLPARNLMNLKLTLLASLLQLPPLEPMLLVSLLRLLTFLNPQNALLTLNLMNLELPLLVSLLQLPLVKPTLLASLLRLIFGRILFHVSLVLTLLVSLFGTAAPSTGAASRTRSTMLLYLPRNLRRSLASALSSLPRSLPSTRAGNTLHSESTSSAPTCRCASWRSSALLTPARRTL
mmetsp:Transcript_14206/g.29798  ORF Transcript_14206/g.29798 Transcript_14206/m.29798 type:complete len:180 (-) Transcript_14206:14-553(-)